MMRFLLRRSLTLLATVLAASAVIFAALDVLPGNIAQVLLGPDASEDAVQALAQQLGLDQPAWQRYAHWLGGLLRFDLGLSHAYGSPVGELILERLSLTLPLALMEDSDWDQVMAVNLKSVFLMAHHALPTMVKQKEGVIINVSSVNGSKGAFGQTNYAAAKAGMHGFSKSLALEVARKGVTVNTISPGYIGTKMVTAIPKDVLDSKILPQIPISRLGKPEEVAGLIIYLCSEEAAFVTGANIAINGGQHMA